MKITKTVEATLWFTDANNRTQSITRCFENRAHAMRVAELTCEDKGWTFDRIHVMRVIDVFTPNEEIEDQDEPAQDCEYCNGTGELSPTGYEYPEIYDCGHCGGTGKEMDDYDPDRKRDELNTLT